MAVRGQDIASVIKKQIEDFGGDITQVDVGTVIEAADGTAQIHGLSGVRYSELLQFPGEIYGLALNLNEDSVGAVILGDYIQIKEGDEVRSTGRIIEVPVGDAMLGRVVDSLGVPIDGKGSIATTESYPVEKIAPGVGARQSVDQPVQFGLKIVDAMVPVGRGQRELVIGDRATGKTSVCIDALINQKDSGIIGVYVAIGQRASKVAQVVTRLEENGALDNTVIVTSNASDPAAMQYLAPYAGCSIAEYFMAQGKDVLIVYDDLTKHAWAYRQMSLLLRRPPGREAYPGDVFYLHSRLLERAARLNKDAGGGSITALPIIETQAGDVSAYVPTNVISITDGQLFLEPDLFNSGVRPAVNSGISVTRVGSSAQTKAMKGVSGSLKAEMAQYSALVTFAQFGTDDLDAVTRRQLERGARFTELLKQDENSPLSLEAQVSVLYVADKGALENIAVENVRAWEAQWHDYAAANLPEVLKSIAASGELSDDDKVKLDEAVVAFQQTVSL
ncbi:MAG: F0F1 ATP synthase subunit alpha [Chloroflexi bacterium]|jgi:F-type H+-transporting ATPase subunit alpha|nr:F0F1 ATP synthase subunit alpha [Chloroflexota bacterium]MBT3864289.1 F0F1 ATP synthase subunit alpha [Chloroflexota bacterium]MBT4142477.1 F0F1 ATP synthase subunit alpha [Chloroflexota bacterium]MBT4340930.1 F0F1 ATP synthase subunit alpha [Chloroflexota bacterium]MBT4943751.1 F0F1 ATP synthase subunit alpha [Chloroflexota bacterium]|tara:strand:- start:1821 stop:3332 length:1512 start_codon:yes stop_codon:yes gene_type:complete